MSKNYLNFEGLSTFLANLKNTFSSKEHTHTVSEIEDYIVDSALSDDSTNPVSNQAIKTEFDVVNADLEARTTIGVAGEVLLETDTTSEGGFHAEVDTLTIVMGEKYAVSFDGTEYVCECMSYMGAPYVGNFGKFAEMNGAPDPIPPDTGEPFVIFSDSGMTMFTAFDQTKHHVVISAAGTSTPVTEAVTALEVRVDALEDADAALKAEFDVVNADIEHLETKVSYHTASVSLTDESMAFTGDVPKPHNDGGDALTIEVDASGAWAEAESAGVLTLRFGDGSEAPVTDGACVVPREALVLGGDALTFEAVANSGQEASEGEVLASSTAIAGGSDGAYNAITQDADGSMVVGNEYVLKFGDVERRGIASAARVDGVPGEFTYIGNLGRGDFDGLEDTGEDFFVMSMTMGSMHAVQSGLFWSDHNLDGATVTLSTAGTPGETVSANSLTVELLPGEAGMFTVVERVAGEVVLGEGVTESANGLVGASVLAGSLFSEGSECVLRIGDGIERRGVTESFEVQGSKILYIGNPGKAMPFPQVPEDNGLDFVVMSGQAETPDGLQNAFIVYFYSSDGSLVGLPVTVSEVMSTATVKRLSDAFEEIDTLEARMDIAEETHALKSDFESFESSLSNGDVVVSEATHATSADSAATATNAGHATMADSATKAAQDVNGNVIVDTYETKDDAATKLSEAKSYADTAIANLVNSAPETLDTLGELAAAFQENEEVVDALNDAITTKANQSDLEDLEEKVVQSDWDINDETSMAYVQNRPFYSKGIVETTIVEQIITLIDMGGQYGTEMPSLNIEEGIEYTVYWQEQEYVLTCASFRQHGMAYVYLGNPSMFGLEANECPFLIATLTEMGMSAIIGEAAGDYTLKITTMKEDVVSMPVKYLPEGYPYVGELIETTLVDNVSFTVSSAGGAANNPFTLELESGLTYLVAWNGTDYTTVCLFVGGVPVIGNLSILGLGSDTGEPFLIGVNGTNVFVYASEAGTHTISIVGMIPEIHKMDEKYLPDIEIPTDILRYTSQSLTTANKRQARTNIGAVGYESQSLTTAQKTQARTNIGAADSASVAGVLKYTSQSLTTTQKTQARTNIGAVGYELQSLTDTQKTQARTNIGAASMDDLDTLEDTVNDSIANIDFSEIEAKMDALENTVNDLITNIDFSEIEAKIYEPRDAISLIDTVDGYTYLVQMRNGNLISTCGISSIEITSMPSKMEYVAGECFDPTGMVVTAVYCNGSRAEIIDYAYPTDRLAVDDIQINISYTMAGIMYTATVDIIVEEFDPSIKLVDFTYTTNNDGTYTITGWKQTLNGEPSTEMIVPDNSLILL